MIKTQFVLKTIICIFLAILFSTAVLLAVIVYYVAPADTSRPVPSKAQPTAQKTVIMDLKTGKPIPEEQVKAMEQKNAEEFRVMLVSGKVTARFPDSLNVEANISRETRTLQIAIVPKTEFFVAESLSVTPGFPREVKQTKISFAEVKVGDRVTLLSDEGIPVSRIDEKKIQVDSLTVQRYDAPDLSDD